MSELTDLYQQVLLDHYRSPRNRGSRRARDRSADGHNPLCGDRITVHVDLAADRLRRSASRAPAARSRTASASLMTEAVEG